MPGADTPEPPDGFEEHFEGDVDKREDSLTKRVQLERGLAQLGEAVHEALAKRGITIPPRKKE